MAKKPAKKTAAPVAPVATDFKFIDKRAKAFHRTVPCICKKGTLDFTGMVEDGSNPPKYVHECGSCKVRYSLPGRFPTVVFK